MEGLEGLQKMREAFPANQVGKLAKGSKAQTQCDVKEKKPCSVCGGFHHPKMVHLDYVGHAALTDRLLDCDPLWTWEPLAYRDGLPAFDVSGGLWIKLTVCGHTRIGYGHAEPSQYKEVGSREKEVIGDALRNAAMRFGAALELWHKGDLHIEEEDDKKKEDKKEKVETSLDAWKKRFETESEKTLAGVKLWRMKSGKEIVATIPEGDKPKLKEFLDTEEKKYAPITCPETGYQTIPATCTGKPCRVGCPEFKD